MIVILRNCLLALVLLIAALKKEECRPCMLKLIEYVYRSHIPLKNDKCKSVGPRDLATVYMYDISKYLFSEQTSIDILLAHRYS